MVVADHRIAEFHCRNLIRLHHRHRIAELPAAQSQRLAARFPSDAAALKLLYLAIRNINQKRGSTHGPGTYRWTEALNTFAIQFPGRLPLRPKDKRLQHLTQLS